MEHSSIFGVLAAHIDKLSDGLKPSLATVLAAGTAAANVAVWQDTIKGWASLITVIISVPTAIVILIYWLFKMRREWMDRNK